MNDPLRKLVLLFRGREALSLSTVPNGPRGETAMARQDEYVTVNELAKILKVNPKTIHGWIKRGELDGVFTRGKIIRIHLETALQSLKG